MQLLPLGKQQFLDNSGAPLAGGSVYFYENGTTVPAMTWADRNRMVCNPNPVVLDSAGEAVIWGDKTYRQVVHDALGTTIWDETVDAAASGVALAAPDGATNIGFVQDMTGATDRNAQSKMRDVASVEDFGATGDGVTDDTAALTAAIVACAGKGIELLLAAGKQYNVSAPLPLYSWMSIRGQGANFNGGATSNASSIVGTNPEADVFATPADSPSYLNEILFSNFGISGGKNGVNLGGIGATNVVLRDIHVSGQVEASFAVGQWIERSVFDHCELLGGQYGFCFTNSGDAGFNYIDKCLFTHCRFSGSVSGFFKDSARNCIGNTFINLIFNGCGQHAWQILGATQSWEIINVAFEANGVSGPPLAVYTGSITAGSNIFTATSTSGTAVAPGQTVTIQGAASAGLDLTSEVVTVSGMTITLTDNAATTQASAELTNALYDELHFGPPSSGTVFGINNITISTSLLGSAGVSDKIRYAVYSPGTTDFQNVYFVKRPLYDPYMQSGLVNSAGLIRTATSWINSPYCFNSLRTADGQSRLQSVFPGNPGVGAMVALVGTGTNGTGGTYGDFSVWSKGPNRRKYFNVSGDTGAVVIGPGESSAQINLGINASIFNGAVNTLAIKNGTAPSPAVANQGFLYVSEGALYFMGASGTVTKLANA